MGKKNLFKRKAFKKTLKRVGTVVSVAAPIAGGVFLGPLGAAAGTALGSLAKGATTAGNRKKKIKAAKKAALIGGAITAGTAVLGAATGGNLLDSSSSILGSVGRLFGEQESNSVAGDAGEDATDESSSVLGAAQNVGAETGGRPSKAGMDMGPLLIGGALLFLLTRKTA